MLLTGNYYSYEEPFVIFEDNAAWHSWTNQELQFEGINRCFNVPYAARQNMIERLFRIVKSSYKSGIWQRENSNIDIHILRSFLQVTKEKIKSTYKGWLIDLVQIYYSSYL